MAVSLSKGQRTTIDSSLKMVLVGLGWDPNKYDGGYDFDLDASAFICGSNGKVRNDEDFVFYNNQDWHDHTIWSSGDDRTGKGNDEGDDEQIFIDFTKRFTKQPNAVKISDKSQMLMLELQKFKMKMIQKEKL